MLLKTSLILALEKKRSEKVWNERCIKLSAPIAAKIVRFLSNLIQVDQFTVEIAGVKDDLKKEHHIEDFN
jgi:hypothetical protein